MGSFQQISLKYLPFPHQRISLLTKYLSQIKMYTYFNIGDAKTFVKLKEKYSKFRRTCSYPHLLTNFMGFFASLLLSFGQVTKLLAKIVIIANSLL